jgi:hypothetical protein
MGRIIVQDLVAKWDVTKPITITKAEQFLLLCYLKEKVPKTT